MADIIKHPKVFKFTPENEIDFIGPLTVLQTLHSLFAARLICADAMFVGAQVCAKMFQNGVKQVYIAGEEAQRMVVDVEGQLYTGPLSRNLTDYVEALQDLHFRGGLINDIFESELDSEENYDRHFTISPIVSAGLDWGFNTPICFRILPVSRAEFYKAVNEHISEALGSVTSYSIKDNVRG